MQVAKTKDVRDNFKKYCDAACAGDIIFVNRAGSGNNVVIVSEQEYKRIEEIRRIEEIEAAVRRSEEDIQAGRVHTANEVREQVRKLIHG